MNITDIRIRKLYKNDRMRAVLSVTFDDAIVVHDIKVIEGPERYFLAMPSQKMANGVFRDTVHPLNGQVRQWLEDIVLQRFHDEIKKAEELKEAEDQERSDEAIHEGA